MTGSFYSVGILCVRWREAHLRSLYRSFSFAPFGASFPSTFYPRLAPWAAYSRRLRGWLRSGAPFVLPACFIGDGTSVLIVVVRCGRIAFQFFLQRLRCDVGQDS